MSKRPFRSLATPFGAALAAVLATALATARVVAFAAVLAAPLGACRDDPPPPAPPAPAPDPPRQGTSAPPKTGPKTREEAEAALAALRKQADDRAHELLRRFRAMLYDPAHDGRLRSAAGSVELVVDGRSGTFGFTFDASKKDDDQVTVTKVRADADLHADAARQVTRFVYLATRGPYSTVIAYAPPIPLQMGAAEDGAAVVVAPPFKSAASVSYRLDAKGRVSMSGSATPVNESTDVETVRTVFRWIDRAGRNMLKQAVEHPSGATTTYDYADDRGFSLLREASITEGVHVCTAKLSWSAVVKE